MTGTRTSTAPSGASDGLGARFPAGFWVWLGAAVLSSLGSTITYFAVNWFASAHGGRVTGLVATMATLPQVVLLLVGGATGDRFGPRRVMIVSNTVMIIVMTAVALSAGAYGPVVPILIGAALLGGAVSAFSLPASGVFPRLFVPDEELGRAMSRAGTLLQVARLVGPPLGGILIAWLALSGLAVLDAATFVIIVIVLVVVRPPREPARSSMQARGLRSIAAGLVAVRRVAGMLPLLGAVGLLAGGVLPALSLCIPLAARQRGWAAADAGLIEGAFIAGGFALSIVFSVRGPFRRAGVGMIIGPGVASVGLVGMALSPTPVTAGAAAFLVGVGTVLFTAHVSPLYLMRSPDGMQSRFQSLLVLVQFVPVLVVNNVYGQIAAAASVAWSLTAAALVAMAAGAVLACSTTARTARLAPRSG